VPVERPRSLVVQRSESTGESPAERSYREEEVAAILHRATQLDRERGTDEGALNLREIEAIARESGIDLSMVRQAARELEGGEGEGIATAIAGAPLRRTIERVVDGEISAEHHERLTQEIREVLSASGAGPRWLIPGSLSSIGRSLTLSGFTGTSSIEVNVGPREGKTFIRIGTDRSQLAGGLFGGIVGGVGGGFGANVGWMIPTLLHLPWFAGLAGAGMVVLGAYALARGIFATNAHGLDRRLESLADRLQALAGSATAPRSASSGTA
jgi:hypothetical protein